MSSFKNISPLVAIFMAYLLGSAHDLYSQEVQQYEGAFQLGKYKGQATFNYRLDNNDTILDGPFLMQRSNLDALIEKEDYSFSFQGTFENRYPEGEWNFQFGEFKSDRASQVVDYQYRVNVSGIQNQASGSFVNGKPDKRWTYSVDRIAESQVEENLFSSSIEYEKGIPQRSFKIENTQYTLLGRCLRNGLAHDEWTLFSKNEGDGTESWFFENGVLKKIQRQENNQIQEFEPYSGSLNQSKIASLGSGYLEILRLKQNAASPASDFNSHLYLLLKENEEYYQQIDDILDRLGEADFKPGFRVLVEHYPLDSLETSKLVSLRANVLSASGTCNKLLEDTQMNILKLSDDQSAYLYAALQAISAKYLEPLGKILSYQELEILDLISREDLFASLWPEEMPMQVIELPPNNVRSTFTGPDAMKYRFGKKDFGTLLAMSEYAAGSVDSIQNVLADKLQIERTQQDLSALEEELIDNSEALKQLVDSLDANSSGSIRKVLKNINQLGIDELSRYSAMDDAGEKLEYGQKLINCFEILQELSRSVGSLPAKEKQINELYVDAIWQPFISVVMDEEVKKRITAAYRKVLIPYILDRLQTELSCDNAAYFTDLLEKLHIRMLELREEDTSKLERKLKKEQDPVEILELFNVKPKNED